MACRFEKKLQVVISHFIEAVAVHRSITLLHFVLYGMHCNLDINTLCTIEGHTSVEVKIKHFVRNELIKAQHGL